jgi:uncharacterized protein (UPF0333 family)
MGAALAAILAIFIPEGSWDWWGTVVGITLSFVIAGYYRIPSSPPRGLWGGKWDAFTRAGAVATVGALCLSIALAYPLQSTFVNEEAERKCRSEAENANRGVATHLIDDLADICVGDKAGQILQPVWAILAVVILIVHLVMWHPKASKTKNATARAEGATYG